MIARVLVAVVAVCTVCSISGHAVTERVVYSFQGVPDGNSPQSNLTLSRSGHFFGTTEFGGTGQCTSDGSVIGCGMVFELIPNSNGQWHERVVHNFQRRDGAFPLSGLVEDARGNLYGTTFDGGDEVCDCGTIFELTPLPNGHWGYQILHKFRNNGSEGTNPSGGLVFDTNGNLYGTASSGGPLGNYGAVFQLSPMGGGKWSETILHFFNDDGKDGYNPLCTLAIDTSGNLFGTTELGGPVGVGNVFALFRGTAWTYQVLHSFGGVPGDGYYAFAGLLIDKNGNLFGTTANGGSSYYGTVFQLTRQPGGQWSETVAYSFGSNGGRNDGSLPAASLIFDGAGNIFGTTVQGGSFQEGTIFELSPSDSGQWNETVLYSFGAPLDALQPYAPLVFDSAGNLYGTSIGGGRYKSGAVFSIAP